MHYSGSKQLPKEGEKGRALVLTQEQKEERRQAKKEETKGRKERELPRAVAQVNPRWGWQAQGRLEYGLAA